MSLIEGAPLTIDFGRFDDVNHHYYEGTDAFTRHLDPKTAGRTRQRAEIDGRQRILGDGEDQSIHTERAQIMLPGTPMPPLSCTASFKSSSGVSPTCAFAMLTT
jgi:hypothetical protein